MSRNILLVEGETDKHFFEAFCRKHNLQKSITVAKPSTYGNKHNTKQGVINVLSILMPQLNDGSIDSVSILVDCDFEKDGGGIHNTLSQVNEAICEYGYNNGHARLATGGFKFSNDDGLEDLRLWVMPDNRNEGSIEDWLMQCCSDIQRPLFNEVELAILNIKNRHFEKIRENKAKVATWLAWQRKPGALRNYAVENGLLNEGHEHYVGLLNWLSQK